MSRLCLYLPADNWLARRYTLEASAICTCSAAAITLMIVSVLKLSISFCSLFLPLFCQALHLRIITECHETGFFG